MFINISGTWRKVSDGFVNINGTWRKINDAFVNISGIWRRFWNAVDLSPQFTVTISQSAPNATTGLITLTGTNYYWSPGPPSLTYRFQWWSGTTWSDISTGTAINPSFGSSTSYLLTLQSTGPNVYVQPNQLNRFRFRVDATYGTQSASSNSSETTIQGPTATTLTAGTPTVTSVPLSWSASTGANRYMVYYSTNNSTFILYSGTNSLSVTITGLSASTLYYFKIIPITGTTNNTGYYGSYSNTVTATTIADLANTALPTITGTIKEGQTVTAGNGSWNVTPDSYAYQWFRFDQFGIGFEGYVAISGATSSTYNIPTNYRSTYGTTIRLRVTAIKSGYTSLAAYSSASTVVALASVPSAPTGATGTNVGTNRAYGNGAVNLSWTAPANNGGVSLTGYKIQFQVPGVGTTWYDWSANTTDTSSTSITLTGLGSVGYKFRIYAVNSIGQSTSASETLTISITTVPEAPTIGTATTFNGSVSITYTGGQTGGSAITAYTATSTPGSITGTASSGAISVTGLTHNTAYTFKVTATNANGTSLASSASNTAYGVNIGAPSVTSSSVSGLKITLNFTAGTNSTSTRAFLNGNLDGSTTASSYQFSLPAYNTAYSLGLVGRGTVNSVTYDSSATTESYTTGPTPTAPTGGSASISGTATQGNNLTLTKTDATGNPTPSASWVWQRNDGGFGGTTYQAVQTGGTTYTLGSFDPSYSIRAVVTWSNEVSPDKVITTNAIGPIAAIYWDITYNANGGTGAPATTKIIRGRSGNVSSSTPTRTGYTFAGWENSVGLAFTAGQLVTPAADIALTAKWTPIVATYTITWNANGGTVSPGSVTVNEGTSVTAPTPTRSGFIFSRWRFPASGGDPVFLTAGESYVPAGTRTWTAIWTVPTPVISSIVARNGGTGGDYKMQWTITSTNTASYTITIRYGTTTSTVNTATATTSSNPIQTGAGSTINDYYILEITPWSGANGTGTAGTMRTTSIKRNTATPSNLTNNY
jgi:uncharacterized repeat protein (TIGR02543 family)